MCVCVLVFYASGACLVRFWVYQWFVPQKLAKSFGVTATTAFRSPMVCTGIIIVSAVAFYCATIDSAGSPPILPLYHYINYRVNFSTFLPMKPTNHGVLGLIAAPFIAFGCASMCCCNLKQRAFCGLFLRHHIHVQQ